ncbi:hypothetical protein LX73_1690 [Fodinibius salinus]|uniref:Glycosyltransferase n=1 Tax=Fodinibius salinus TaxID=860790 RepID=A0A5D3YJM1_9BACT|nr:TIGR04282 family arsenosugar biosynthesis glycosyltransferase [Fodinibius salinus]TYP93973.1 hypothetical protein LX73_1690 [Fodinibius salinus]
MSVTQDDLLLIFIKNPEPGTVKTRLARTIGDGPALKVYQKLLTMTREVAEKMPCRRQIWYSKYIDENDRWDSKQFEKKVQQGVNLGERMQYAFRKGFKSGADRIVIIGSDCADLQKHHLDNAFRKLQEYDVVIGPSQDGGYYLLGMRDYYPILFKDKEWSTGSVYQDTVEQAKKKKISLAALAELNDIDTESDMRESDVSLYQK